MDFVPWTSFARIVDRYSGNAGVRTLSCAEQFRAMAFAQLTWRESLRDIEASVSANASKLYAMGFRSVVKRSTLADANEPVAWMQRSGIRATFRVGDKLLCWTGSSACAGMMMLCGSRMR
jgi:hypothetical protein